MEKWKHCGDGDDYEIQQIMMSATSMVLMPQKRPYDDDTLVADNPTIAVRNIAAMHQGESLPGPPHPLLL